MNPTRLFDYLPWQNKHCPLDQAFGWRHDGKWEWHSTSHMVDMTNRVSLGLLTLYGVKPGDKIALVSQQNRPEWVAMDAGILQIGAVSVPVYPTISRREFEYIFNEAEVKYCFCGGEDLVEKVRQAQANVPSLLEVFSFDELPSGLAPCWKTAWAEGDFSTVQKISEGISPDSLATIIYTSGTTGDPKGVMISHAALVSNVEAVQPLVPFRPGDRVLSFLPLNHIFERAVTYSYLYNGVSVAQTSTDNLGGEQGDLKTIKPHFFTAVPRLLEKVYDKIFQKGLELKGFKRRLFFWALRLADGFDFGKHPRGWAALQWKIADRLVFSKWREALGGNVRGILTGSSACPVKIIRTFCAAGIPIREGYGLTETPAALTINHYTESGSMLGTVGQIVEGVELKLDAGEGNYGPGEGEILARCPNLMMGYFKKPEATAAVFKELDGKRWFCTGDIGRFVLGTGGRKFLQITDRKKELLKTSGGKYVAPQPIESKFREDFLIEQIMVVGEQRKFVAALIVPAQEALRDWCTSNGMEFSSLKEVICMPKVVELYQSLVEKYNPLFGHVEQIKKFRLLDSVWETVKPDGSEGELTPTMKLKRRVILHKYGREIEELYSE